MKMGLVSTWLDGIGLGSAVPTFHAAGITTPSALAELDVNHFEALGISDPNDRRKLFYLVQRIKMAVNKEKPLAEESTMEEKVEAMISSSITKLDKEEKAVTSPSKEQRRSKRISKKDKEPSTSSKKKESSKEKTKKKITKDKTNESPSKKKKASKKKSAASKKVDDSAKTQEQQQQQFEEKKEDPLPIQPSPSSSNRRTSVSASKANAVFNLDDTREPQDSTTTATTPANPSPTKRDRPTKLITPKASSSPPKERNSVSPARVRPSKLVTPKASSPPRGGRQTTTSSASSPTEVAPRSPSEIAARPSGLQPPSVTSSSMTSRLQAPKSRATTTTRPEFKMQNPGMSIRTGKSLSVIPDKVEAQMSPLNHAPANIMEQQEETKQRIRIVRPSRQSLTKKDSDVSASSGRRRVVQGQEIDLSWARQVEYLREDNNAEHELFCSQAGDELYEYDMKIRVIVRKRPLSKAEAKLSGGIDVIHTLDYGDFGKALCYQPKTRVDLTKEVDTVPFAFDNVFDETSTNVQIYQRSLRNLIEPFFMGQWSTCFAYGQTGSGKTYTMMGSNMTGINAGTAKESKSNFGLYYLAALDIFDMVKRPEYQHLKVQVSLFEIYGGKLFDLLNDRNAIKCLEDSKGNVCFPGLTEYPVDEPDHLMQLIQEGSSNRSTGTTSRNADSSRSHAVLQLKLRKDVGRRKNIEHGRLSFIDLAGSERGADTSNCSKATRLEGAEINTSLLALKEVIRALATGGSMTHIPFRGSKLTQVLKDSFVGENSRCCMVACISPDIGNCEQTLNTLRYADRVKERNAESGALPSSCEEPVRLNLIRKHTTQEEQQPKEYYDDVVPETANMSDDEHGYASSDADISMNRSYQSSDTNVLNDLLESSSRESDGKPQIVVEVSPKHTAGQNLIKAHRSIMSSMLAMVKNEMTLVNKVDGDRDDLQEYILELEKLQSTQLGLLSNLRGALHTYVAAAEEGHDDDDSDFEDLRD